MKIIINQTLHGYQDGHQLLNTSMPLDIEEKKQLLFQSDLTGSNVTEGYKTYITGYPISASNIFAFSKTWYADEMPRPGCVWTHTLLISFSDLGKIPEFSLLLNLFKRPKANNYLNYSNTITFEAYDTDSIKDNPFKDLLISALYNHPDQPIIIPSDSSLTYERIVLDIWSDQWPRLRRNFSFCTGSLSPKLIDNKDFDLQITPQSSLQQIARQRNDLHIVDKIEKADWLSIIERYPKNSLRGFLWRYGSDVEGKRSNYVALLKLFDVIQDRESTLSDIVKESRRSFPLSNEASYLKKELLGRESILTHRFSEQQILNFLILNNDKNDFVDSDLVLEDRLKSLIQEKKIDFNEFYKLWKQSSPGLISDDIWSYISINNENLNTLLENNDSIVESLIERNPELALDPNVWKGNYSTQRNILQFLCDSGKVTNWYDYIASMLEVESDIIFEAKNLLGDKVIYWTLDWVNYTNKTVFLKWAKEITLVYYFLIDGWLQQQNYISTKVFILIFSNMELYRIQSLHISTETWISAHNSLKKETQRINMVYVSSILLSIGFNNRTSKPDKLIASTFHDVYSYAASAKIDSQLWNVMPKDLTNYEDESNFFEFIISALFPLKKKDFVEDWDYCEILIRTLANKYIKNFWPYSSFLETLNNQSAFKRTLGYLLSFKKGRKFLKNLLSGIKSQKIKPLGFQLEMLQQLINSNYFQW